ncbi:MAG: response regulator [Candidatus Binatia bacterium]
MKKALVIEDHPDSLDVLSWQLETLGFAVVSANNGREGVEKAIKEKPDLILMDIMMPGMDGREATRRIRNNPDTKNTLIMATTVLYKGSDLRSCMEAGCNDYILKPFTFEELREKIQEYFPQ